MRSLRVIFCLVWPLLCTAFDATITARINESLQAQKSLKTIPCEQLSIFSLRMTLSQLLSAKKSKRAAFYPIYDTEADMKKQWAALPGVQPGDNPESMLLKHAHCHEAAMWFTQHLTLEEQTEFSAKYFLPLLPTRELLVEGADTLSAFYKSKVTCSECFPMTEKQEFDDVNKMLQAQKHLRVVPCEQLSIFSIRTVLKDLIKMKKTDQVAEYPIYKTEDDMKKQWAQLPGVQPGDNSESRLVKFAHCHEAVMWFTQHLTTEDKAIFSKRSFLPLLPKAELPLTGRPALIDFYAAKVKCPKCSVGMKPSAGEVITV
jgi:hypothetical protein